MMPTNEGLGTVSMLGKDTNLTVTVNALAVDRSGSSDVLEIISCCGPSTTIKAFSAGLTSNAKVQFRTERVPNFSHYFQMQRHPEGYTMRRHKLAYSTWHLLAIAREPGLLTTCTDEAVWHALRSQTITTPLMRHWVPWLKQRLVKDKVLLPLKSFGCEAYVLRPDVPAIDLAASAGVKAGQLQLKQVA